MSSTFNTPNMNLPSPVPGQEVAPTWAQDNYNCFALVDSHNHSSGQGVQINPTGININANLPFNGNNATLLRSARFTPQSSVAGPTDIGCLYEIGVDLYYNDGSGNQIRITQSGSVSGASGTITGLPSGTASAAYSAVSGTFVFQQATSTAANMDIGTLIVRYPGSYPSPSGNYIALQAPTSLSGGYAITLPAAAPTASGSLITMSTAGVESYSTIDGTSLQLATGVIGIKPLGVTTALIADANVTTAKIADANVTTAKIANGAVTQAKLATKSISYSAGITTLTSATVTSFTTYMSVTFTTTGRPIVVKLDGDQSANASLIGVRSTTGNPSASIRFFIDGVTAIGTAQLGIALTGFTSGELYALPPSSFSATFDSPAAGSHTVEFQVITGSNTILDMAYMRIAVYEL